MIRSTGSGVLVGDRVEGHQRREALREPLPGRLGERAPEVQARLLPLGPLDLIAVLEQLVVLRVLPGPAEDRLRPPRPLGPGVDVRRDLDPGPLLDLEALRVVREV